MRNIAKGVCVVALLAVTGVTVDGCVDPRQAGCAEVGGGVCTIHAPDQRRVAGA